MKPSRTALSAAALLALAACADGSPVAGPADRAAPLFSAAGARRIEGQYIVVLNEGADPRSVAAVAGVSPRFVYTAALNGFAAALNEGQLGALRHNPNVRYVEQNQQGELALTQTPAPTGLDRIDQRALPLDNSYSFSTTAFKTVYAYVIDTGLQADHPSFNGRAANVYDFEPGRDGSDCTGHGTHVAGIIGAETWGVARRARLRGVRVVRCDNFVDAAQLIAGVDWVYRNHIKPAVANISIRLNFSDAVNAAVTNLANAGVFTAVGAGNSGANACNSSPASAAAAVTVAASDPVTDQRPTWSNHGPCVDIYAPGVDIRSTWIGSTTNLASGTSMASPHVAGVVAGYKAIQDASTATVTSWLINNATTGVIQNNPVGTPNRLLYKP